MATTTIQLRIDKKTKENAQDIFKKLGMDMSSAMKLFLSQVIRTKSIPFVARTENGFTPEYEQFILEQSADALKNGRRFKTVKEVMDDLEN
ncbi:MAG: type II toxin-antitoxin system RelB/DinJ family antitoxin [bacterium]|nr:type II toxin-antitoxin system RelB/DinJ family antitoxin [bacterium]